MKHSGRVSFKSTFSAAFYCYNKIKLQNHLLGRIRSYILETLMNGLLLKCALLCKWHHIYKKRLNPDSSLLLSSLFKLKLWHSYWSLCFTLAVPFLKKVQLKMTHVIVCYMFIFPNWMDCTHLFFFGLFFFKRHHAIHLLQNNSLNQMVLVTVMESYNVKITPSTCTTGWLPRELICRISHLANDLLQWWAACHCCYSQDKLSI